jgi:membrane-associated phospholipid phosphatase
MQLILDLGIKLIISLQSTGTWFILPMQIFSFLGTEEFFLVIAPVVYWCIDAGLGLRLGLFLMISSGLNDSLKVLCHAPRPYWIDARVKAYSVETSFGIPSGHAMHSTTIWGTLAASLRKWGTWIAAILLIFMIGLSRLYLGMHFPSDVLAGWFLGALLVAVLFWVEKPVVNWIKGQTIAQKIILAFILSLVILAFGFLARFSLGNWETPADWIQNAASATGVTEPINPIDPKGLVSSCGALFGLALGYFLFEAMGGFQVSGTVWQKTARFLIGLVGILLFWKGLGLFLPTGFNFIAFTLRYVRYCLIGVWVTAGAPWVFIRAGLSKKYNG